MSESQQLQFIEDKNNKTIINQFNLSLDYNSYDNEYSLVIDCDVSYKVQQALQAKASDFLQYS
jgi:hypothetical protein